MSFRKRGLNLIFSNFVAKVVEALFLSDTADLLPDSDFVIMKLPTIITQIWIHLPFVYI